MQSLLLSYAPSFLIVTCGLTLSGGYLFLSTIERNIATMRQCEALAVFVICFAAAIFALPAQPTHYIATTIDANGDLFIIGDGSTCNQAYRTAVYPAGYIHDTKCVRD